ncbi:(d)CMP kinase [Simiduia curdlanivorans]|uniref:Cytidylate kinase n=1 Tax=Simiduia curdlanivorans TaxID=1492769 RepID=A0ABV8V8T5_9GAMM|nr:(d)CMP kinase [Simiduia curdlanivorans]MDN3639922.1 (d)CMP kinase [Simiduia curdlanivorans]
MNPLVITIDGPSGSGKGTVSQRIAQTLGLQLLDSGALYRLVALVAVRTNTSLDDAPALAAIALNLDISFQPTDSGVQARLAGEDVSLAIRAEAIGLAASQVAAIQPVRDALLARQRAFAVEPGLVADGRDMGTAVFPNAQIKIYLTASAEERANRRYNQLKAKGESVSLPRLLEDIQARDARDMNRQVSPLKPAEDAVIIDSSLMGIDEVQDAILAIVDKR